MLNNPVSLSSLALLLPSQFRAYTYVQTQTYLVLSRGENPLLCLLNIICWLGLGLTTPIFLFQGSSIFNDVYGSVNRTGLVIAGAALIGVSGLAFLGELNAIPNVDGVADSVKGFQGFMEGVVSRFQVNSSISLVSQET